MKRLPLVFILLLLFAPMHGMCMRSSSVPLFIVKVRSQGGTAEQRSEDLKIISTRIKAVFGAAPVISTEGDTIEIIFSRRVSDTALLRLLIETRGGVSFHLLQHPLVVRKAIESIDHKLFELSGKKIEPVSKAILLKIKTATKGLAFIDSEHIADSIIYDKLTPLQQNERFKTLHPLTMILVEGATKKRTLLIARSSIDAVENYLNKTDIRPLYDSVFKFCLKRPELSTKGVPISEVFFLKPEKAFQVDTVSDVKVDTNEKNELIVAFQLDQAAAEQWSTVTAENINKRIAICLGDLVFEAPTITSRIEGGSCKITGAHSEAEAISLKMLLTTKLGASKFWVTSFLGGK